MLLYVTVCCVYVTHVTVCYCMLLYVTVCYCMLPDNADVKNQLTYVSISQYTSFGVHRYDLPLITVCVCVCVCIYIYVIHILLCLLRSLLA
jgi:hypothetical protein